MPALPLRTAALALLLAVPAAHGADDDDALSLQSAPAVEAAAVTDRPMRLFIEGAVGRQQNRYLQHAQDSHRLSLDISQEFALGKGWRGVFSDRLDSTSPVEGGETATLNSLRELYAGWQDDSGTAAAEMGRFNLRNGPGYGFNPTDYFRRNALRSLTTADPLALRENRLGTVMLHGQRLWNRGALSVALAPKLADRRSNETFNADLGATNSANRALATWSQPVSDKVSAQALVLLERDLGAQLGASATALLSDASVGYVEFSRGRQPDLLAQAAAVGAGGAVLANTRNQLATGLTYTTASRLSLTLEYQYNGAAPGQAALDAAVVRSPIVLERYLRAASDAQNPASRRALLLYAMQKGLVWKSLDLTGLIRHNADDRSNFAWVELRHHWAKADLALQWQVTRGTASSEYGSQPLRQAVQVLGTWYF